MVSICSVVINGLDVMHVETVNYNATIN